MLIYSRPPKLDHSDTIHYEISMLRYAALRLDSKLVERDAWVHLEAFLLHYRNLIEFLGNDNPRPTDLYVTTIWALIGATPPARLAGINADGRRLFTKYERNSTGRISQYLQHCTEKRIDDKNWEVSTMMNELEPLLCEVEQSLPKAAGILGTVPTVPTLSHLTASTTVGTSTATGVRSLLPKTPQK
jgi:hypothetical protein